MILSYFLYRTFIDVTVQANGSATSLINTVPRCSLNAHLNLLNSSVALSKYSLYTVLIYIYFVNLIIKKEDWKYLTEPEIERIVLTNSYLKIEFLKPKMKENSHNRYFHAKSIKFLATNVNECNKLRSFSSKYSYYWFFKNGLHNPCELNLRKHFTLKFTFIFVNPALNSMSY